MNHFYPTWDTERRNFGHNIISMKLNPNSSNREERVVKKKPKNWSNEPIALFQLEQILCSSKGNKTCSFKETKKENGSFIVIWNKSETSHQRHLYLKKKIFFFIPKRKRNYFMGFFFFLSTSDVILITMPFNRVNYLLKSVPKFDWLLEDLIFPIFFFHATAHLFCVIIINVIIAFIITNGDLNSDITYCTPNEIVCILTKHIK